MGLKEAGRIINQCGYISMSVCLELGFHTVFLPKPAGVNNYKIRWTVAGQLITHYPGGEESVWETFQQVSE